MDETLVERVLAAKHAAEAAYSAQTEAGHPLTAAQHAEILIAQVNAIISGPPATVAETPPATEEPKE